MKTLNVTRKELEAAPQRAGWTMPTTYDSLYLLPTRKKHDSGYHLICIVGSVDGKLEQAAICDDICWNLQEPRPGQGYAMRTDMTFPGGVVHVWGWDTKFRVGMSLSSTEVDVFFHKKEPA